MDKTSPTPLTDRKSILITGAASGIGAATAKLFSSRGWYCGLYDINRPGLTALSEQIGAENCHTGMLDVTQRDSWKAAVDGFGAHTGGQMHVLFNNAGIAASGWLEDVPHDKTDQIIDTNLKGVINGIYACLPLLKATPGARIVNTASVSAIVAAPRIAVYSATKFAVRGLTDALDAEFRGIDVRVTSLVPWFISTPILNSAVSGQSNQAGEALLREAGVKVYPVELAAEVAWDAAHGNKIHYLVGAAAKRTGFFARFLPWLVRRRLHRSVPERS
ncbi:MAG: SDR family oxidoreductase [Pseudomonadota bacterium]